MLGHIGWALGQHHYDVTTGITRRVEREIALHAQFVTITFARGIMNLLGGSTCRYNVEPTSNTLTQRYSNPEYHMVCEEHW